ncbi:N-acetyltransferase family protein [Shimia sp. MIT1388]|uniref:GNAT family N-acetyltransferase n=1 Tax=Shimia sp. MIT1388 TaxID=3096992 RepID=UPI003999AB7B
MSGVVRKAEQGDAKAMAAILQGWLEDTPWMPVLHTLADTEAFCKHLTKTSDCWVADGAGRVSGFVARDKDWVTALYLAPDARGRGVGATLLAQAKADCDALQLWCFQSNEGARRFYERHGFVAKEFTDGAGNDEKLPDVRFVWRRVQEINQ